MKWLVIGAFLLAAVWRIRRALPRRLSGRSIGTRRAGGPPTATHSRAKTANGASSEVVLGHITRLDATPQNNADQPVFSAADVIGRMEPDGSVTVIALEGIDDVSEKRRRLRLTRTIDMYSPTLGDVDRCGVAFARLAGCTNPVQLTRPVVFNSSRRVFLPSNRITAEVRIGYADKVGKEAASLFSVGRNIHLLRKESNRLISVIGVEPVVEEGELFETYLHTWCNLRSGYRQFALSRIQYVIDDQGDRHDPAIWVRVLRNTPLKEKR
jgi:hypothetical protein